MSTPHAEQVQSQAFDLIGQGQDAVTKLFGALSENWSNLSQGGATSGMGALSGGPAEMVDRMYDTGIQMLETQRAMAHGMLNAAMPAWQALTAPATPAGR